MPTGREDGGQVSAFFTQGDCRLADPGTEPPMGQKLVAYYKYMSDLGGIAAKIKLATKTKLPSTRAASLPDSPENIAKFRAAIAEITGKPAPIL